MQYSQGLVLLTGLAAASVAYAQSFTANTPASLTECRPVQLTWTGGQAPYYPRITAPGDINTVIKDFGTIQTTSVTWTVDVAAGQTVTFSVGDSAGNTANSAITPAVLAGSTDCLNGSSSSSSSANGSSSNAASTGSSSTADATSSSSKSSASATSPASSSSASTSATKSASSTAASATATSTPNSANSIRGASAVVAGVIGVAVAALL
ncbi:hypothetical protein ACQY0O_006419 [Thecaphora frezii]